MTAPAWQRKRSVADAAKLLLDPRLAAALKSRAQEEGATFSSITLAAFNVLLHRYTGQDDLCVGVPIANRPRPELENLIGYFTNTLVPCAPSCPPN